MDTNPEKNLLDVEMPRISYGTFWPRAAAVFIDGLVVSPLILPLTYYNMIQWKNPALYVLVSLLGITYKPFCEFMYGATIGKKVLKLKVVSVQYGKATLAEVLGRNIFNLTTGLISIFLTLSVFTLPGFEDVHGFMEYSTFISQQQTLNWFGRFSGIHYVIDSIFLWTDSQKRTLHDRIGRTYVIKQEG
jgi:uncharacterized RDD family membrane protein YckC